MRRAIVTVVTRNYAHFAQVLMGSCRRFHPNADLFVCYADRPPQSWKESTDDVQAIYGDELAIENWKRFAFQYTPFELSCALKPFVISELLDRDYDEIAYLDGDMVAFGPLTEVFSRLESDSIVLTPHLLKPLPVDGKRPDETAFLIAGTFNAGFFAVRNDANTHGFIEWWKQMCLRNCYVDLSSSIFVDQKWLSLVPGMFEGVHILRNPGYNAGHWTLSQFPFTSAPGNSVSESGVAVGGNPLVLFHFSGMTPSNANDYLVSQTRTSLDVLPALQKIVSQYHRDLTEAGMSTYSAWGCEFDQLANGSKIHLAWREAIRQQHKSFAKVADPFDTHKYPHLPTSFAAIEPGAYKWRRDWRLKWPKDQGAAGQVRKVNKRLKSFFKGLQLLRRSA